MWIGELQRSLAVRGGGGNVSLFAKNCVSDTVMSVLYE